MDIDFKIMQVGYNRQEKDGFRIDRPYGSAEYLFIHFLCDADVKIENKIHRNNYGACIIYEPGFPQWYKPANKKYVNSYFHFQSNNFKELAEKFQLPLNNTFHSKNDDFIEMVIKDLETEFIIRDLNYTESINGSLLHLFSRLGRFCAPHRNSELNPTKVELVKKFNMARLKILQTPEHDWTLKEMADLLNICTSRFCIHYKEIFHISPKADLIMTRISRAKYMLTNEALSVEQIAEAIGYNSVFHFIRQFKSITGCTPGKYYKNK